MQCTILEAPAPHGTFSPNLWPAGIVPYEFDANVNSANQNAMVQAMNEWEAVSPVDFRPRAGDPNYLHIQNSTGNNSYVGMIGGGQVVNIFNWNFRFIMAHELGHALGLWHEHQRPDRDQYVQINTNNIQSGYSINFNLVGTAYGPYDFDSVMHYGSCALSTCCPSGSNCSCSSSCYAITVLPPNQSQQGLIGQRTHLSAGDAAVISHLYAPAGSCCTTGGCCSVTTQAACNGSWSLGGACTPNNPCIQPPSSATASPSSACPGASVTLTASGGAGGTHKWYSGDCGGTLVGSGSPTVITAPGSNTTYYVRMEGTCGNSGCVSTPLTISPSPTAPTSASASSNPACPGTPLTLTAFGGIGTTLEWFAGACGGPPIGAGNPLVVSGPFQTTTYYARWTNGCEVSACASVPVGISTGQGQDCNTNGIPDNCESPTNTIVVNSTADPGVPNDCLTTLREALAQANATGGMTVLFHPSIAGASIRPISPLPNITGGNIIINGDIDGSGTPDIEIDGSLAGNAHGLYITSSNNQVRGLCINRFSFNGILLNGTSSTNNIVSMCYVGVALTGNLAAANGFHGIAMWAGASASTIGPGNLLSGNHFTGVAIESGSSTTVRDNRIGTDRLGTAAIPNAEQGVVIRGGAHNNTIGPGNLISGNTSHGITVAQTGTNENAIVGNLIGLSISGLTAIPNQFNGIRLQQGVRLTQIGGPTDELRNVISGNGGTGIYVTDAGTSENVITNNRIGTNANGQSAVPNVLHGIVLGTNSTTNIVGPGNLVSGNGSEGIILLGSVHHNVVFGNLVGVDATGLYAIGNYYNGIKLQDGAHHNTIGNSMGGNLCSGNNNSGINLTGSGTAFNTVERNLCGTNASGSVAIPNSIHGIQIKTGASDNVVGPANVLSGNTEGGIEIKEPASVRNAVRGNRIGLKLSTLTPLSNGHGVELDDGATDNMIGGTNAADSNLIQFNLTHGVWIDQPGTVRNTVRGNSISANGSSGIRVSANAQQQIQPPLIQAVSAFFVQGTAAVANGSVVEVFKDADSEGVELLGTTTVVNGSFQLSVNPPCDSDITATITDLSGNTSEFGVVGLADYDCNHNGVLDVCETSGLTARIYWTDPDGPGAPNATIKRSDVDGTNVETVIGGLSHPRGMVIDQQAGRMYWAEPGIMGIRRANLDGTNIQTIVPDGQDGMGGIALDVTAGKIYWTEVNLSNFSSAKIRRANLDGSSSEVLITGGLVRPGGVAVDSLHGKLYWTDHQGHLDGTGRIQRANLDGSNVETLLTELDEAYGIAVDSEASKLYWSEAVTGKVQRSNLDGTGVQDLVIGQTAATSLALNPSEGKMYWTNSSTFGQPNPIRRANLDGSEVESIVSGQGFPWGIAISTFNSGTTDCNHNDIPDSCEVAAQPIILVSSKLDDSIRAYDPATGALLHTVVPAGSAGLDYPNSHAVAANGDIYVCNAGNDTVLQYSGLNGSFIRSLQGPLMRTPSGILLREPNDLLVTNWLDDNVIRFDLQTGLASVFVLSGLGGLDGPGPMARRANGNVLISGQVSQKVHEYDSNGVFVGIAAQGNGLNWPIGLLLDTPGNLFVSNYQVGQVLRFAANGNFLGVFVPAGSGGLTNAEGMTWLPSGNLLLCNRFGGNVLEYNGVTGAFVRVFASNALNEPNYVVVGLMPQECNANGIPDTCEPQMAISVFVNVLLGNNTSAVDHCLADANRDGMANGMDVQPYVLRLIGG